MVIVLVLINNSNLSFGKWLISIMKQQLIKEWDGNRKGNAVGPLQHSSEPGQLSWLVRCTQNICFLNVSVSLNNEGTQHKLGPADGSIDERIMNSCLTRKMSDHSTHLKIGSLPPIFFEVKDKFFHGEMNQSSCHFVLPRKVDFCIKIKR